MTLGANAEGACRIGRRTDWPNTAPGPTSPPQTITAITAHAPILGRLIIHPSDRPPETRISDSVAGPSKKTPSTSGESAVELFLSAHRSSFKQCDRSNLYNPHIVYSPNSISILQINLRQVEGVPDRSQMSHQSGSRQETFTAPTE